MGIFNKVKEREQKFELGNTRETPRKHPGKVHWVLRVRYVVNSGQNFVNVVKRTAPKDVFLLEFWSEADTFM